MKFKHRVGDLIGVSNALLVKSVKSERSRAYEIQCQICKEDKELHNDATYTVSSDYITAGKLPCGCSRVPKWSKEQWVVLISRKAVKNNHIFNGLILGKVFDQNIKLKLSCRTCSHSWESCSINNYMKDRGCPECAKGVRAGKRSTPDIKWIERFRNTGVFPESQYSFKRIEKTGRLWNVSCFLCQNTFISDRSNIIVGKIPCDCSSGGGYDVRKSGYIYILYVNIAGDNFIKFGISNSPRRRLADHRRNLLIVGGEVLQSIICKGTGPDILRIETDIKRTIKIHRREIEGFRKESCSLDELPKILRKIEHLEVMEL